MAGCARKVHCGYAEMSLACADGDKKRQENIAKIMNVCPVILWQLARGKTSAALNAYYECGLYFIDEINGQIAQEPLNA